MLDGDLQVGFIFVWISICIPYGENKNGIRFLLSFSVVLRSSFVNSLAMPHHNVEHEVAIALGSNVGDRLNNFSQALRLMRTSGIQITRHGCLYESLPAYVIDQPLFLNSAVRGTTTLEPHDLLSVLKKIERDMGRKDHGIRYGPRPIDLDILFYGKYKINSEDLVIPHERIWERPFVMAPLIDLLGSNETDSNDTIATWDSFSPQGLFETWDVLGGELSVGKEGLRRVLPIRDHLWDWSKRSHVMGVLNVTPDSFSDGGKFESIENAVLQVKLLISEGVDIIDIGAQSTRPNAPRISPAEEMNRLIPILEAVKKIVDAENKNKNKMILLSVDTFHSEVAREALKKGVDIINDVSGGQMDPHILKIVSEYEAGYCIMHMRGDPSTMQKSENLDYGSDVCRNVAHEIYHRMREAELHGIPAWRIMVDPGIGFSKKLEHNLEILMGLATLRRELGKKSMAASHTPLLIGPSRKRFLGKICDREDPIDRDSATAAAVTAAIFSGANIVRVHNVKNGVDAAKLSDALIKFKR